MIPAGHFIDDLGRTSAAYATAHQTLIRAMLDRLEAELDAGTEVSLDLLDAMTSVARLGPTNISPDLVERISALYRAAAPIPPPEFDHWIRQYQPTGQGAAPWQTVMVYSTHEEAHRGLLKARASQPGEHRIIGVAR